jgi:hypothetical protein
MAASGEIQWPPTGSFRWPRHRCHAAQLEPPADQLEDRRIRHPKDSPQRARQTASVERTPKAVREHLPSERLEAGLAPLIIAPLICECV